MATKGDQLSRKQLRHDADERLAEATTMNYLAGQTYLTGGPTNEMFRQTICANRGRYGDIPSPEQIQRMYNGWGILETRAFTPDTLARSVCLRVYVECYLERQLYHSIVELVDRTKTQALLELPENCTKICFVFTSYKQLTRYQLSKASWFSTASPAC